LLTLGDVSNEGRMEIMWEFQSVDAGVFQDIQSLLDDTYQRQYTTDRGCAIHGPPGDPHCDRNCKLRNPARVPTGFAVVKVEMVKNEELKRNYTSCKARIKAELIGKEASVKRCRAATARREYPGLNRIWPVESEHNEWRLFHGGPRLACESISRTNFDMSLWGTGGSPRKPGQLRKKPLFGTGAYFCESSTKADEYAREDRDGCSMLLCRVVGGSVWEDPSTDGMDPDSVFNNPSLVQQNGYHSVMGSRVFNEFVVYDRNQIFPEFIVTYRRR